MCPCARHRADEWERLQWNLAQLSNTEKQTKWEKKKMYSVWTSLYSTDQI